TIEEVPTLSTATKPTSASLRTWWEQVDWLIPSTVARSPTLIEPLGAVATACSRRTRVASESVANHSAYVAAESAPSSSLAPAPAGRHEGSAHSSAAGR